MSDEPFKSKSKKPLRTVYTIAGHEASLIIPPSDQPTEVKVFRARKKGGKTTVVVKGAKTQIKRC